MLDALPEDSDCYSRERRTQNAERRIAMKLDGVKNQGGHA